ncbi:putative FAD-binding PCMH-type domain-containing protein [Seiridium cardinale]|uniref:FAD-binding PCMH-type domain-containing protein n=1 Tax=Seiridium cardinale TaxID=138064 RepID=A0ABR2XP16_9PEZI
MAPGTTETAASLRDYLQKQQRPDIKLYTPSDDQYEAVRECFVIRPARPFAIARPQNAEDVQTLVKFCIENVVDMTVRGGGHDPAGRTQVHGALVIDMRDINYVRVDEDRTTARVGGGVLVGKVMKELGVYELVTPCGMISTVGYTGWATLGGYGPLSSLYGIGVDQIVHAKLVNAQGEIVDADGELLRGIRGGGGIFGPIVELTIKVYLLKEILLSTIVYEPGNIEAAWLAYIEGYERLLKEGMPRTFQLQPMVVELPSLGKVLIILATWADPDHEEGRRLIDIIAGLNKCAVNLPEAVSLHKFTADNDKLSNYPSHGRVYTTSIKRWTPKTAQVLAKYGSQLPGGGTSLTVHGLRGPKPNEESVWGSRVDHHVIELISVTADPSYERKAAAWALAFQKELLETDPENVLESSYISLLGDEDTNLKKIYGGHYDTLLDLKRKYDPQNVFKYAIPKLPV